jgi:hypothetical protein
LIINPNTTTKAFHPLEEDTQCNIRQKVSLPSSQGSETRCEKVNFDCNYYFGSATQAADYETTAEFIINCMKKSFDYGNDIGTSLKKLSVTDSDAEQK